MNSLGRRNVVIFYFSRTGSRRFKFILQIAFIFFTSCLVFGALPFCLLAGQLGQGRGATSSSSNHKAGYERNLRIVVFGSPDIIGNTRQASSKRRPWTEDLCNELKCSIYTSFVPQGQPNRGLISNALYGKGVQDLLNITKHTNVKEKPALDFCYIAKHYPTPYEVPDLSSQVRDFLTMPPPKSSPFQTLWIFSFGTWEVWNMAAMPRNTSQYILTSMARHILDQAEMLFEKSLDPKSIAFSGLCANITGLHAGKPGEPDARLGCFQILIPMLIDISLTPGWQRRLKPPTPNSVAEQTRNAVELTKLWNQEISSAVVYWNKRITKKPEENVSERMKVSENRDKTENIEPIKHRKAIVESMAQARQEDRAIEALYPLRSGLTIDVSKVVLDAMTESQMQHAAVADLRGRGTLAHNDSMWFADVGTPCVQAEVTDLAIEKENIMTHCESDNDHLFYDSFTISERASRGVVSAILKEVKYRLLYPKTKGVEYRGNGNLVNNI